MAFLESSRAIVARPGPAPFVGPDARRTVVWLWGDHDIASVDELATVLAQAIALDDADVVLDLSKVGFLGAATLGVIDRARVVLGLRSRSLALRSPSASALRVLDLCESTQGVVHPVGPRPLAVVGGAFDTWMAAPRGRPSNRSGRLALAASVGSRSPLTMAALPLDRAGP